MVQTAYDIFYTLNLFVKKAYIRLETLTWYAYN